MTHSSESLLEATITQLHHALSQRTLTSRELVDYYADRIARLDKSGPTLNSVLELNPEAWLIAEALDAERESGYHRGPLHGIPVLIKDNIDTADMMHTSAGSIALTGSYAVRDAWVAERLRRAGAILLGKTNMTEWANFMADNMPNGYSSRGGQVLNPYGPGKLDVGGSSSGSGAAIAANLATAAVGTETSGSILSPSNQNSLVGIKPTAGLISRRGIIPIAFSQDTAGPMARTVEDAAIMLGVLTGIDEADPATRSSRGKSRTDYTQVLTPSGLRGVRLGIPRKGIHDALTQSQEACFEQALRDLERAGAVLVDSADIPNIELDWQFDVLMYEFKPSVNAYLGRLSATTPVHSLRDVIAYNQEHQVKALQYGQAILERSEATSGLLTEPAYIQARVDDFRRSRREGIDAVIETYKLDALLLPSYYGCHIPAKAGYPSVTVPAGYVDDGAPFGITFTSLAYSEADLIRMAYAYEQNTRHRKPPHLE